MLHKYIIKLIYIVSLSTVLSCQNESLYEDISSIDSELLTLINENSNGVGVDFFTLPNSTDYKNIPQDPLNPITEAKVALGKLLVHETATGGNPKMKSQVGEYSCASCHPVVSGFYSGNLQGIGEGGYGFWK